MYLFICTEGGVFGRTSQRSINKKEGGGREGYRQGGGWKEGKKERRKEGKKDRRREGKKDRKREGEVNHG